MIVDTYEWDESDYEGPCEAIFANDDAQTLKAILDIDETNGNEDELRAFFEDASDSINESLGSLAMNASAFRCMDLLFERKPAYFYSRHIYDNGRHDKTAFDRFGESVSVELLEWCLRRDVFSLLRPAPFPNESIFCTAPPRSTAWYVTLIQAGVPMAFPENIKDPRSPTGERAATLLDAIEQNRVPLPAKEPLAQALHQCGFATHDDFLVPRTPWAEERSRTQRAEALGTLPHWRHITSDQLYDLRAASYETLSGLFKRGAPPSAVLAACVGNESVDVEQVEALFDQVVARGLLSWQTQVSCSLLPDLAPRLVSFGFDPYIVPALGGDYGRDGGPAIEGLLDEHVGTTAGLVDAPVDAVPALVRAGVNLSRPVRVDIDPYFGGRKEILPLALVACQQSVEHMAALLDAGVDPDFRGPGGDTVLHLLASAGRRLPEHALPSIAELVRRGADLSRENDDGESVHAAYAGLPEYSPIRRTFFRALREITAKRTHDAAGVSTRKRVGPASL